MAKSAKRQGLSKTVRFEVFKRDSFACQYCGRKAPDVILHVDHIDPVANGGDNSVVNLITSCQSCNAGKSDVPLSVTDRLDKERRQLAELQERREQLQMMAQWRRSLRAVDDETVAILAEEWGVAFEWVAEPVHIRQMKLLLKRVGFESAVDVIVKTGESYSDLCDEEIFKKLRAIERGVLADKQRPGSSRIAYIIGIMNNKYGFQRTVYSISALLNELLEYDTFSIDKAVEFAKTSESKYAYEVFLQACLKYFKSQAGEDCVQ